MKLHEKISLEKDINSSYKEWSCEYYDWVLYNHKEDFKYLKEAYEIADSYNPIRHAMRYWYGLTKDLSLSEALFYLNTITGCESPIESLYYSCFEYINKKVRSGLSLVPQLEVETENKKYRVDFMICNFTENELNVIVECDGYEFHSSSKQMAKDNQRQRDLENAGYTIIRFSGSEIYNDPVKCVYETLKRLNIEVSEDE